MVNDTASANLHHILEHVSAKIAENHEVERVLLTRDKQPAV